MKGVISDEKRDAFDGKSLACSGVTLVELLIAMVIASLVGGMILQMVIGFQSRILTEISRNDLQDRAERLIRFMVSALKGIGMWLDFAICAKKSGRSVCPGL